MFMDNSACKKAVKSFKIKLSRKLTCSVAGVPPIEREEYLKEQKFTGCEEKTKTNRTLDFELPSHDKEFGTGENLHPDMRHMKKMLTDSSKSAIFRVDYRLDVFVKHQSKMEFGMGNVLNFPITIHAELNKLPFMSSKESTWLLA